MSTRAVTMITKRYPDDHLSFEQRCHSPKRSVHKILTLCEFWLRRYLTAVWCHVFQKRCHVNPACVYYCSIRIQWHVKFLSHSTYKFYSLEIRWWVVCVDPAVIILSIFNRTDRYSYTEQMLNTVLCLLFGRCHILYPRLYNILFSARSLNQCE